MANAILGLLAETSIHAGAGSSAGVIDLPIQREAHTGWPCVYGSAVKGALRAAATSSKAEWIADVFGPDTANASDHAGALAVGDARLLLLPVRSLTTHFKWVTCPALLRRAKADAARLGVSAGFSVDDVPADEALVAEGGGDLYLEEFRFSAQKKGGLDELIVFLASLMDIEDAETRLQKQLTVVSDNRFAYLATFGTPVAAHIAINNETKTVSPGALWYEETLPPETVLYVCLMAQKSRKTANKHAAEVLAHVTKDLMGERPYLQIGGNETVGMGWCKVKPVAGEV